MKKLLATTALIGAATAFAGAANAETPNVSVGGSYQFSAGWADQEQAFETGANSRDFKFRNDTRVKVNVNGKADNGLGYGAVIELQADVTPAEDNSGFNADKTYLFLESGLGRVELGANTDAARALKVDSSNFARATGGIDGEWDEFVNTGGVTGTQRFIKFPELPTAEVKGVQEHANKVTYYSPRFQGFQFGASFTPDQGDTGTSTGFTGKNNGDYENVFNLGVNYAAQVDQVGVTASLTGEFGESESAAIDDLEAFQAGVNLAYQGFTVGGSYGDWGNAYQPKVGANNDSKYWDVGAAYETGPYGISVGYLNSEFGNNDLTNLSVGADYKLAAGLTPFIEANFFELDQGGTNVDNEGTVVLVGTNLNF